MSFGMIVSIGMGCYFGRKGFYHLGFRPKNVDFTMGKRLLVHLREVFLSSRRSGSSTSEATRDGVDSAT